MDDQQDGLPTYVGQGPNAFFDMPDLDQVHNHLFAVTYIGSHEESCADINFDHIACRGPDSNNQHHPVPNHNHPRSNLNTIPMNARRHHSLSTMPTMPNFFDPRGQMPLGFGAAAIMSPTAAMGFPASTPNSSPQLEDDSTSAACSSSDCNRCVSDCGASDAGDICTDIECAQACDDDDCDEAAAQCMDAQCPANEILSEKDKAAADVLASIGGDNFGQDGMFAPSMPSMSAQYFASQGSYDNEGMPAATQSHFHPGGMSMSMAHSMNMNNSFQSTPDSFQNTTDSFPINFADPAMPSEPVEWMSFGLHLSEHAQALTDCVRPCLLNNLSLPNRCPLPHHAHAHPGQQDFSFCLPDSNSTNFVPCGVELNNIQDWANHFQEQHVQPQHLDLLHATQQSYTSLMAPHARQSLALPQSPGNLFVSTNVPQDKESPGTSPLSGLQTSSSPQLSPATAQTVPSPAKIPIKAEVFICQWENAGHVCGMVFQDDEGLQRHCKESHIVNLAKTDAGYKCCWEGCAREGHFTQKSKLERHLQTHTGFKPVKCDICHISLSAKQSLAQHMRIHTGEKPWDCKFPGCTASFKQQSALTMHSRTHTGEKPLKCEVCGKAFGESSNLSKHRKTHNVKGAFKCDFCDKDFHRLDQKRRHEKIHRKEVVSNIDTPAQSIKKTQGGRITKASNTPALKPKELKELKDNGT
ncbi:zinc-responsiveness transcriptional activator [Colletotrichum orchidophilum]|uniref:Zinc-responsiveness transcriptional activator n=1 Tax=Colletotrichum orchidophilum TaxID=1209926 RepID=A0A1G4BJ56_9PEZI|nr:zinc-responsiveness transcriptional activator [Colletotrichum orchidophilum]OHF01328.1 zinc-responsiveness transcriptional activator [Colletotrichum orchidophilum]